MFLVSYLQTISALFSLVLLVAGLSALKRHMRSQIYSRPQ